MRASMLMPLAVVAVLAGACADQSVTTPTAIRGLHPSADGPSLNVVQAKIRTLQVCAEGPAGSYGYSMSIATDTKNTVLTPMGTSYALLSGQCAVVVQIQQGSDFSYGDVDPNTLITVTQIAAPAGTQLDHLQSTQQDQDQPACVPGDKYPCGIDTREAGPTTTIKLNFYHGSVISYWNTTTPSTEPCGCTYTQGYWKNHSSAWPSGYSPSAAFFNSGMSWMEVLQTPPKGGNAYLILAHQWIAATLNIANGASMPSSVQSAYDNGEDYLSTGSGSDPIGWASTLDNYNNGLANGGPGHCGESSGGNNDHHDSKAKHHEDKDHGKAKHDDKKHESKAKHGRGW